MQKINLLYIITKLELGGAQKQLLGLINHLDNKRFKPFLFTAQDGLLIPDALAITGLQIRRSRFLERPLRPLKDVFALIQIYRYIKKNNIDIVHTHSSKAGVLGRWAAKFARARFIIHTVHGWSFNDYQAGLMRKFYIWLERITAKVTDKIIVVSNFDKYKGLNNNIGPESKYSLIRYGIDYAQFNIKDNRIKEELRFNTNDMVVGMVACLKPQKSPQDFIKLAFLIHKALPDIKFILAGNGVLRENIERLICQFGLEKQVFLLGWRRDIPKILSAIDVLVLTSLWEGLPIVALEAMASSCPVVATDTGGIREVIQEGKTGFLVAPGDIEGMARKTIDLLKDRNLRKIVVENAKVSLGFNFQVENMARESQGLYSSLIGTKEAGYAY
jgi:glycosyltransferase involved in cell wall biosynthesis